MANIKSAKKRACQAEKRRQHNMGLRSRMRTYLKNTLKLIDKNDQTGATEAYQKAVPVLDSMANKGLVHKNFVARHKSRLLKRLRAL